MVYRLWTVDLILNAKELMEGEERKERYRERVSVVIVRHKDGGSVLWRTRRL